MGIKAVTGLPGSKQAELTSVDVAQEGIIRWKNISCCLRDLTLVPAATQPGSGSEATEDHHGLFHHGHKGEHAEGDGSGELGFKGQVKAYAKIHRGTVCRECNSSITHG
jgi:hypothetical protein